MIGLLIAEVVALTLRFDTATLNDQESWLAVLISHSHWCISLAISMAALAGLAFSGVKQGDPKFLGLAEPKSQWLWLPGHLAAYAGFAWLTRSIFERLSPSSSFAPWVALWISAGLASLSLWMLALLPLDNWYCLLRRGWRAVLFGFVAGIVAVLVGQSTCQLWSLFHRATFWAVRNLVGLFSRDVICQPERFVLGVNGFEVTIFPECSGYQGIGLIWAFLGAHYWWFRRELRFPHALLLVPLGTALSWVANVTRIAALVMAGASGWRDVAIGGFHSQAGWLAFNGIGLGLVMLSRRVRVFSKMEDHSEADSAVLVNPTAVYVGPLVAIALTTMATSAVSEGGFDRFYPARVAAAVLVFWYYRRNYTFLRESWSWFSLGIGLVVFVLWSALEPASQSEAAMNLIPRSLSRLPGWWAVAWLTARVIGSVIVIPLAEELAFRGYLTRRLIANDFSAIPDGRFSWSAIIVSSLLFGLLHQRWLAGTIAGLLFALAYYRRGKLIDAVVAHATTNMLITISVFWSGEWHKWS